MAFILNPANIGQLPSLVQLGLINWHQGATMSIPATVEVRSLFFEKAAEGLTEEHAGFNESGFSHVTTDDQDYALVSDTEGDHITLTQVKRTVRRKITEDLIEFNRYSKVASLLRKTGTKLWRGYALDLAHRFTFAFDTSYTDRDGRTVSVTGGDGAAMCADTHTLNNSDTYDNKLTARLSESALEDAEDLGAAMIDQNGEQVNPTFTTLVTANHAATKHMAKRLTGQQKQVGTDLNDANPYYGEMRHVVVPYLDSTGIGAKNTSKSRYWFIIDESLAKGDEQLIASVRTMPTEDMPTVDPNNKSVQFTGKMRYDIGHLDAHWVVGSAAV